jgi:hypothetical protein
MVFQVPFHVRGFFSVDRAWIFFLLKLVRKKIRAECARNPDGIRARIHALEYPKIHALAALLFSTTLGRIILHYLSGASC